MKDGALPLLLQPPFVFSQAVDCFLVLYFDCCHILAAPKKGPHITYQLPMMGALDQFYCTAREVTISNTIGPS
jgi:hypothetical protein